MSRRKWENIYLSGSVLQALKEVQKERQFSTTSYTARVLLMEQLVSLGIIDKENGEVVPS